MFQQPQRNRSFILTYEGKRRLEAAIQAFEHKYNYGEQYTIQELSDQTGLDTKTIRKVLNAEAGVNRSTLEQFFQPFALARLCPF
jgi:AraC-like DNA-binding protein